MIKWLKDRQLGNTVDRKTIYEHLGPNFLHRGTIDYGPYEIKNLTWTSDDNYLVSFHRFYTINNTIVIWENPNTHTEERIKSKIDLEQHGVHSQASLDTMNSHRSNVLLGGGIYDDEAYSWKKWGVIYSISLLNGNVQEMIRNGLKAELWIKIFDQMYM